MGTPFIKKDWNIYEYINLIIEQKKNVPYFIKSIPFLIFVTSIQPLLRFQGQYRCHRNKAVLVTQALYSSVWKNNSYLYKIFINIFMGK